MDSLLAAGTLPIQHDQDELKKGNMPEGFSSADDMLDARPLLMGQAAGAINDKDLLPASAIVDGMIDQCCDVMRSSVGRMSKL